MSQMASYPNSTITGPPSSSPSTQVSPQSALFGLLAVALFAMNQPSILTAYSSHSDILNPHRSSPFICMIDTLVYAASGACYLRDLVKRRRQRRHLDWQNEAMQDGEPTREAPENASQNTSQNPYSANDDGSASELTLSYPTALTMSITLFVLGVLPQAVKLFAMQGIPFTQIWTAMFLISSLVSGAARVAGVGYSNDPLRRLLEDLYGPEARISTSTLTRTRAKGIAMLVGLVLWLPISGHILMVSGVWWQFANQFKLPRGEFANFLYWIYAIGFICVILSSVIRFLSERGFSRSRVPSLFRFPSTWWPQLCFFAFLMDFFEHDPTAAPNLFPMILERLHILNRFAMSLLIAGGTCLGLSVILTNLAQFIIQASKYSKLKAADNSIKPVKAINPLSLIREIRFKIKYNFEAHLHSNFTKGSRADAISRYLHLSFERLGYGFSTQRMRLLVQSLVAFAEGKNPESTRPGRQFAFHASAFEHHQDFVSTRWRERVPNTKSKTDENARPQTHLDPRRHHALFARILAPFERTPSAPKSTFKKPSAETQWIAFSLFNLLTAAVYYLYLFDGSETVNPSWTGVLG